MADRILTVQTITASAAWTASNRITLPTISYSGSSPVATYRDAWGQGYNSGSEYYPTDRIVYVFDNFTGSFELVQNSGSTQGITIYDETKTPLSGPWRLVAGPPCYLYNSGSNSQTVKVTVILVR